VSPPLTLGLALHPRPLPLRLPLGLLLPLLQRLPLALALPLLPRRALPLLPLLPRRALTLLPRPPLPSLTILPRPLLAAGSFRSSARTEVGQARMTNLQGECSTSYRRAGSVR